VSQLLPTNLPIRFLVTILLLVSISPGQTIADPDLVVACSVVLEGNSTAGPAQASVRCSGGSIKAAADDPAVLRTLQRNSSGVSWQSDNCGMEPGSCMLVICEVDSSSTAVLQMQLSMQGVVDVTQQRWAAVCITGDTKAVLQVGGCWTCWCWHHRPA
jgi:hypothetical protein